MDEQQPIEGHKYVFGVDWGREPDPNYVAIIDTTANQIAGIRRYNRVGWFVERAYLMALDLVWKPTAIWVETNSIGNSNIEALQAEGLRIRAFTANRTNKENLIRGLSSAIHNGELAFPDDQATRNEVISYMIDPFYELGTPRGVIALALSWYGARYSGAGIDFV